MVASRIAEASGNAELRAMVLALARTEKTFAARRLDNALRPLTRVRCDAGLRTAKIAELCARAEESLFLTKAQAEAAALMLADFPDSPTGALTGAPSVARVLKVRDAAVAAASLASADATRTVVLFREAAAGLERLIGADHVVTRRTREGLASALAALDNAPQVARHVPAGGELD